MRSSPSKSFRSEYFDFPIEEKTMPLESFNEESIQVVRTAMIPSVSVTLF